MGISGSFQNLASTGSFFISSENLDVSLFTPLVTPRVLDQPVVHFLVFIAAITNSEHTVVKLITAVIENTSIIELEILVDGDSNRDGDNVQGSLQLLGLFLGNHGPSANFEGTVIGSAGALEALVREIFFSGDSAFSHIVESIGHGATIATVVFVDTVHQSLFGEIGQFAGLDSFESFNGAGGRESPARSAVALVLDRGDGVVLSPVHGFLLGFVTDDSSHFGGKRGDISGSDRGEFIEREVHEFVLTERVGTVLGVSFIYQGMILLENRKSAVMFMRTIFLVELGLPSLEFSHQGVTVQILVLLEVGEVVSTSQEGHSNHGN